MFRIKTILAPVDFSDRSAAGARRAAAIASHFGARLILIHVIPPGPFDHAAFESGFTPASVWPSPDELETNMRERLEAVGRELGGGVKTSAVIERGAPADRIERCAVQEDADLVVIPTHGYGTFRRFALGSVTMRLLDAIDIPVLTGAHMEEPSGADDVRPYKRIACAVDLSRRSEAVLSWAAGFAAGWDADLHALHAGPPLHETMTRATAPPLPENLVDSVIRRKTEKLASLVSAVGCEADLHVDCGRVADFVTGRCKDIDADLLVIGRSHIEGPLGRLRTHSYELIRKSPVPVASI